MATISCQKLWTLTVGTPPSADAYWTLNEGNGFFQTLSDSTGNNRFLQAILNYNGSTPALFSNGALCTSAGPDLEMNGTIPYSQVGWSVWGWVKILSTGPVNDNTTKIIVLGNTNMAVMAIGSSIDPGNVHLTEAVLGNELYLNITAATWHFFHLFYSHSTQKVGLSFDNGVPSVLPSTTSDAGVTVLDFSLLFQINDPSVQVLYDEIGMIGSGVLNATQLAYLYNSGSGRTWPIVLP